jgi:hypothetical protein
VVHLAAQAEGLMRRSAAAAVLAASVALAAGCGSGDDGPRAAWVAKPKPVVVVHPELPGDRLLIGRVRNATGKELRLDNRAVRVLDRDGRPVRTTVRFNLSAAHGLYSPADEPRERPRFERERLGDAATLLPGRSVPLVVAWHAGPAARAPVTVDLGPASLTVPPGP